MDLISHPFRLTGGGTVATVPEGSDEADAELIASLVLTHRGERPYVPAYGIDDPAFAPFEIADLRAGVRLFAEHIDVELVDVTYPADDAERVLISF